MPPSPLRGEGFIRRIWEAAPHNHRSRAATVGAPGRRAPQNRAVPCWCVWRLIAAPTTEGTPGSGATPRAPPAQAAKKCGIEPQPFPVPPAEAMAGAGAGRGRKDGPPDSYLGPLNPHGSPFFFGFQKPFLFPAGKKKWSLNRFPRPSTSQDGNGHRRGLARRVVAPHAKRGSLSISSVKHIARSTLSRLASGQPPRVKEEVISSDCPPDSQTPRGRLSGGCCPPAAPLFPHCAQPDITCGKPCGNCANFCSKTLEPQKCDRKDLQIRDKLRPKPVIMSL